MTQVTSTTFGSSAAAQEAKKPRELKDLDVDQFLQLMITELTNQDPLNPMDNTQLVEQISQIRSISATTQLSDTLGNVQTSQSLSTASGMIGKKIKALTADGTEVNGVVDKVSVDVDPEDDSKRSYRIHVGDKTVPLSNVREVVPA